jgi:hypothetical protein
MLASGRTSEVETPTISLTLPNRNVIGPIDELFAVTNQTVRTDFLA